VIAVDLNFNGLRNARDLAATAAHRNVEFVCADLTAGAPVCESTVEYVLLDGAMHRPRDVARASESNGGSADRPRAHGGDPIADARACGGAVRPEGAIVYSVVAVFAPGRATWLTTSRAPPGFEIDSRRSGVETSLETLSMREDYEDAPRLGGLDGFFAARLISGVGLKYGCAVPIGLIHFHHGRFAVLAFLFAHSCRARADVPRNNFHSRKRATGFYELLSPQTIERRIPKSRHGMTACGTPHQHGESISGGSDGGVNHLCRWARA